jgi:Fur family transcriptional regulator, ferric uptake regulator
MPSYGGLPLTRHDHAGDWAAVAEDRLREHGHKASAPRSAVLESIGRQRCVVSAQDIADELKRSEQKVGIATVYRTLEVLEELRLVQRLDLGGESARFEPAMPDGRHHHHHFVCRDCGAAIPFEDEALERAIGALEKRLAASVDEHDVILKGRCPDCV